jgi:hypothetical protein
MSDYQLDLILQHELSQLDGINAHDPETGVSKASGAMLGKYTTKLFGAPYQLLDSVDRRFGNVNTKVGSEYLRNFLLNSPILYIKPGMPRYSGDGANESMIRDIFVMGEKPMQALLGTLAKKTLFGKGKQLQRRMFGFRETYMSYMNYVNYMCKSVARYLSLENMGTFLSSKEGKAKWVGFCDGEFRWENYRMFDKYVATVSEYGAQ